MIYDNIKNIDRYESMQPGLAEGLRFLRDAALDLKEGRHLLSGDNFVNVDVYTTKHVNPVGYEAHRRYIDIQYLLEGEEDVLVRNLEELECTMPYSEEKDVAFYRAQEGEATRVRLGKGYFVVLFPEDAHEPQHCVGEPQRVKKLVAKIRLNNA